MAASAKAGAGARSAVSAEAGAGAKARAPSAAAARTAAAQTAAARLQRVRGRAAECRDCPLWREATQTVFGEGSVGARIMLVGEQPGDREDLQGKPFVGPAGALLDRALAEAGIDRSLTYTTNAVKHFKYRMRGKRRIHQRPDAAEVAACRQWLDVEIELVRPRVLVCLGATAAGAVLGGRPSVERERGRPLDSDLAETVMITAHPSAALRQHSSEARHAAVAALVADLEVAARAAKG
jgi:uracil-DNA glycosylase